MSMLNKLLNRKDGGPQKDPPKKPVKKSDDTISQGFLCPICYSSFENSDTLSSHFATMHDSPSNSNNASFNNDDAQSKSPTGSGTQSTAAADSILKKYAMSSSPQATSDQDSVHDAKSVSSLNDLNQVLTTYTNQNAAAREQQLERDLQVYKEKFHTAEEIRSILTNDIKELQDRVEHLAADNKKLGSYKMSCDEKLKSASDQFNRLKNENEQTKSENSIIKVNLTQIQEEYVRKSQQIGELENELTSRPAMDDFTLLKKELVQVQQLTDTILKEKENEHKQLVREQKELTARLENLKVKCKNLEDGLSQLQKNEEDLKNQLSSKKNALDKQTTELTETHEKLDQLKLDLEQKTSQVTTYLIEIKELNQEKNQLSQNVAELEARKAEMSARIHESPQKTDPDRVVESEDTAAQQLSDELASLAKEKDHLENELIKLRTKNQSMNDEKITWLNEKNEFLQKSQQHEKEIYEFKDRVKALENEKPKLEAEKASLQNRISELEVKLDESVKRSVDLAIEKSSMSEQIVNLEKSVAELNERISQLISEKETLERERDTLTATVSSLSQKCEENERKLNEMQSQSTQDQTSISELNLEKQRLQEENTAHLENLSNLKKIGEENEKRLAETDTKLAEAEGNQKQTSVENHDLKEKLDSLNSELKAQQAATDQLKLDHSQILSQNQERVTQFETQINDLNGEKHSLTSQINELEEKRKTLEQSESGLKNELSLVKINLENTSVLNDDLSDKLEKLASSRAELNAQVEALREREAELVNEKETLVRNETVLQSELSVVKETVDKSESLCRELTASLQNANDTVTRFGEETSTLRKEHDRLVEEHGALRQRVDSLVNENDELAIERDDCEKIRLEAAKKHETQLKALNQNLASTRVELKSQTEKIALAQQELNAVKGSNLELEAKLANCTDERNQLLERCIVSEKMCEGFKVQNVDLKRRLEDTQSALQELGREHQSLQVMNYKKNSSKWVDDSLVDDCGQCKKAFSVTIRKHHCRNCGYVFCNECSSNTAMISSSNKPQRVCKACFVELTD